MVKLFVKFKPYTSRAWAVEKLTELGLYESFDGCDYTNPQFLLMANMTKLVALVEVPKRDELRICRAISMISPQVVSVSRA